jgi:DeoR/GlpR family transcriptional regulator of sugar metabolism
LSKFGIPAARLERIRELVSRNGIVALRDVKAELGVSEMTVRRDFAALEESGVVRRTRGGVVAAGLVVPDRSYDEREALQAEAKQEIGSAAATLIEDGDTIFLSGGTTCLALAVALQNRSGITVVTNSLQALPALVANPDLRVIATGGLVSALGRDFTGPPAEVVLRQFRARRAFIGASGLTRDGVFNSSLERAATDRLMIDGSVETTLLADHTKIGRASLALVVPLSSVTRLITDQEPNEAETTWLTAAGVSFTATATAGRRRNGDDKDHLRVG